MLSLYRAWLGPNPRVGRPVPPPGALRPVPRRAAPPPSPCSTSSSELDVEALEQEVEESPQRTSAAVLDVACCDGPVRFTRVLNAAWSPDAGWARKPRASLHYYPCKTCGCKFPSYYFVHKHRKQCHAEESPRDPSPQPSTSAGIPTSPSRQFTKVSSDVTV